MSDYIVEPERKTPVMDRVDVLVAGGGVAGVSAAIGAARAGARTMLVERMGFLGGVAGPALMTSLSNFFMTSDGRQVVKGVLEELLDRLAACGGTSRDWRSRELPQVPFDQEAFRRVLAEMLHEAGVETLVEAWAVDVVRRGDTVEGAITESKGGRQAVLSKATVDTTGDADLAARAGAPFRNTPPDSASLLFFMRGADLERNVQYFEQNPHEWQQYQDMVTTLDEFVRNWRQRDLFHLPHGGSRNMTIVKEAIARGEYSREFGQYCKDLDIFGLFAYRASNEVLINSCNFRIDQLDPRALAAAELEARRAVPYIAGFLQKHMPGFEHAVVSQTASMVGVRITRWIESGFDLKRQDVVDGAHFDDTIGAIASHDKHPKGGTIYLPRWVDLPYRIMLPQGVENLLVSSGKSVSTEIRGMIRGQVQCYVLGQAGGVAAAVAARDSVSVRNVNVREVQRALLAQNVFLGDAPRLQELGLA